MSEFDYNLHPGSERQACELIEQIGWKGASGFSSLIFLSCVFVRFCHVGSPPGGEWSASFLKVPRLRRPLKPARERFKLAFSPVFGSISAPIPSNFKEDGQLCIKRDFCLYLVSEWCLEFLKRHGLQLKKKHEGSNAIIFACHSPRQLLWPWVNIEDNQF